MKNYKQPWLADPFKESIFILAPALVPVAFVFLFQDYFLTTEVSTFWWIVLVLCIDVSHVYSTLFRLYWDRQTFTNYKQLLILIPCFAFIIGFALHYYDSKIFWRVLAYIAVFHFIRQQYGFMRLYSRKETHNKWTKIIDTISIYNATLYPILYWHIHLTNKLSWFVPGDFISIHAEYLPEILLILYLVIILLYLGKELWISYQNNTIN